MDEQIRDRILRPTQIKCVIPGSTPVISFGDFTNARIASLSINPSSKEFLKGKDLLPLNQKRLVDRDVLGISAQDKISEAHVNKVWEGCCGYFSPDRNPYSWFDDLESILNYSHFSYFNGTASHIDLVQSATFPAWASLTPEIKRELLDADYEFFKYQTALPSLEAILINGRQVFDVAIRTRGFELKVVDQIFLKSGNRRIPTSVFTGVGPNNKRVFGWTGTLKSLRIDGNERASLYANLGERLEKFLS